MCIQIEEKLLKVKEKIKKKTVKDTNINSLKEIKNKKWKIILCLRLFF